MDDNSPTNEKELPVVAQALQSNALMAVIIGKTLIALALAGVAIAALFFGAEMILPATDEAGAMILEFNDFKMSSQGLGAVIMMSGVILGILSYLCRPQLLLTPRTSSTTCRGEEHLNYDADGNLLEQGGNGRPDSSYRINMWLGFLKNLALGNTLSFAKAI